jgi:type I restriction enzyme, S subunit
VIQRVRISDVLELQRRTVNIDPTAEYSLIGVYSFGKGIFHREPVPGGELGDYRFFRIEPGDLVLSNIQAWEGAIAHGSATDSGTIGTHRFLTYTARDDRLDTNWARWFFLSEPGMELIRKAAPGTTIRNRTLAIDRFEALEIPFPPIDEQRRVSAELDRIAAATENATQLTEKASEVAAALGVSIASRPDLTSDAKASAGWTRMRLGEVLAPAIDSIGVDAAAAYPNIGIYSFGRGVFEKPDIDGSSTSASTLFRVRAGQFIYSRLFAFEGAYSRVPFRFDGYFVSNEFPVFDADISRLDTRWLATFLRSPARWAELGGASKGIGVRRQRVPVEAVLKYEIWLPPLEVQHSAVRALERIDESSRARGASRERLKALMRAVLNEAFEALS